MYRMRKDLIGEEPDVVFVEFAVNDAGRSDPTASKPYMEGDVYQRQSLHLINNRDGSSDPSLLPFIVSIKTTRIARSFR